jgi:hypothetical protein
MPLKLKRVSSPPVSISGNSVLFNGSNQYLSVAAGQGINNFGTGDFTIETWVYFTVVQAGQFVSAGDGNNTNAYYWQYYGGQLQFGIQGVSSITTYNWTPSTNTWYHVAVTRSGTTVTQYINGASVSSGTSNISFIDGPTYIAFGGAGYFNGRISNVRILKGTALYTSSFTPPTSPLTAIANTSLLTCNAATIIDNSSNNFTITNNGTATVSSAVTPFTAPSYASTFKFKNVNNNRVVFSGTQRAIFGYGGGSSITNLVSNSGVVANDTAGVGTARFGLAAAGYGSDKAIFGYGYSSVSMTNLVSNTGVVAADTTGVGTGRHYLAAAGYGSDKAIFGYGYGPRSMTNLVSNTGVVATDTTGVGTARFGLAAAGYGSDKAIFGYGYVSPSYLSMTNKVGNTGVVAADTTGVGTGRYFPTAAGYGSDKAIFGYGNNGSNLSMTNLVSNTGIVATDTTGVGTARYDLAAAGYGSDKAIFGYGWSGVAASMTNLVSNTGVVSTDTTGVGTARNGLAAAGFSNSTPAPSGGSFKKVYPDPVIPDFTISPAYSGKSSWNLTVDGPLVLSGSGAWTVTPMANFNTTVKMWGAGGARGYSYRDPITSTAFQGAGGAGGYSTANIVIQTGNSYILQVGQGGIRTTSASDGATYLAGGVQGSYGGTQGGGYSGIFITSVSQANALLMAGGGGGGSDAEFSPNGGAGGGTSGQDGAGSNPNQSGKGGSQSAGGAAAPSNNPTAGSALTGGLTVNLYNQSGQGAGGGGYWGGGGGNVGGGGGGSGRIGTHSSVTGGTTTAGAADVPGNSSDASRGGAGRGGNATSNSGADGTIIITKI